MQHSNKSFESSLHDIVYSIDTGTGLKIIRTILYSLVVLVVMLAYTATQFGGLKSEESMDYAQLARNISNGRGMTTKCVRPMTINKMMNEFPGSKGRILDHPDVIHPPLYPAVLAVGLKLFDLIGVDPYHMNDGDRIMPAERWVVLPMNHIFALLTGLVLLSLGKRLFSRDVGFWSMTIYYMSNLVWKDSISSVGLPMVTFFVVFSIRCLVISILARRENKSKLTWLMPFFMAILCSVLAFYTRYISILIIPGLMIFLWFVAGGFRGGTRLVIIFVALYMLLISPWLYRNYKLTGNPAGMVLTTALADSDLYPDTKLERTLKPETLSLQATKEVLKRKWVDRYKNKSASLLPGMGGGILMAFFITTFFYQFVRPFVNYLRWGLFVSLLLFVFVAGFFSDSSVAALHMFWPFVVLYGFSFFVILLNRLDISIPLYTAMFKIFIVILSAIPLILSFMPPQDKHPYPPYYAPLIGHVSSMLSEREVMMTDMPWATAWYGDRVSILLAEDVDGFYEINDYLQYISGLYITTITRNRPFVSQLLDGPESSWFKISVRKIPRDFPLRQSVYMNRQDQIFLSDRNRWSTHSDDAE